MDGKAHLYRPTGGNGGAPTNFEIADGPSFERQGHSTAAVQARRMFATFAELWLATNACKTGLKTNCEFVADSAGTILQQIKVPMIKSAALAAVSRQTPLTRVKVMAWRAAIAPLLCLILARGSEK